jgi:hypothetical protein
MPVGAMKPAARRYDVAIRPVMRCARTSDWRASDDTAVWNPQSPAVEREWKVDCPVQAPAAKMQPQSSAVRVLMCDTMRFSFIWLPAPVQREEVQVAGLLMKAFIPVRIPQHFWPTPLVITPSTIAIHSFIHPSAPSSKMSTGTSRPQPAQGRALLRRGLTRPAQSG